MLISSSPVFYAMLCGRLKEEGDIVVPDIEPGAFKLMLRLDRIVNYLEGNIHNYKKTLNFKSFSAYSDSIS